MQPQRVTEPLRRFVEAYGSGAYDETHKLTFGEYQERLLQLADKIDAEHRRRMYQQAHDIRKAACRYFRSVIEDYRFGIKRKRRPTNG